MRFLGAIRAIYSKLHDELPSWLTYHDLAHAKDVYRMTRHIGRSEGIDNEKLKLILTAALLHDAGFITGNDQHEKRSCVIARKMLPQFEYTATDIETVERLIMATTIPHQPNTLEEKILCDADLDYLGRNDFVDRAKQLFIELKYLGIVENNLDWNKIQVKFLNQHQYFTSTAIQARMSKKNEHLKDIIRELDESEE